MARINVEHLGLPAAEAQTLAALASLDDDLRQGATVMQVAATMWPADGHTMPVRARTLLARLKKRGLAEHVHGDERLWRMSQHARSELYPPIVDPPVDAADEPALAHEAPDDHASTGPVQRRLRGLSGGAAMLAGMGIFFWVAAQFAGGETQENRTPLVPLASLSPPIAAPSPTVQWTIVGATCLDGWPSQSIGRRGACSHHGGVATVWQSTDHRLVRCRGAIPWGYALPAGCLVVGAAP